MLRRLRVYRVRVYSWETDDARYMVIDRSESGDGIEILITPKSEKELHFSRLMKQFTGYLDYLERLRGSSITVEEAIEYRVEDVDEALENSPTSPKQPIYYG